MNMKHLVAAVLVPAVLAANAASVYEPNGVTVASDAVALETVGETVWTSDFTSGWSVFNNYDNHLEITFGGEHRGRKGVVVRGFETNRTDTAWSVRSDPVKLTKRGPTCIITFDLACDREVKDVGCNTEVHRTAVLWLDAAGKRIDAERIPVKMAEGDYGRVRFRGKIPAGAAAFQIQLGFDGPNLINGQKAAYANLAFAVEAETPRYLRIGTFTTEWMPKGALRCRADKPKGTSVDVKAIDVDSPHPGFCRVAVKLTGDGTATPSVKTLTVGNRLVKDWTVRADTLPPRVRNAFPSPTANRFERLVFTVTDDSVVDASALAVTLDGKDATAAFEYRDGRLVSKPRTEPWADGLHTVDVTIADVRGNKVTAKKRFFVGTTGAVPKVTLRDDGVTLVDGQPYFPICMYGVMRREFNGNDFGRAFDGLAAGGFNTSHSYSETFDPSYLDEGTKHGFMRLQFARYPDHRMVTKSRFDPSVLAWYLGDDTSICEKPWELWDYEDAVKAVDPDRLTCQADTVGAFAEVSNYRNYVTGTDVFLPEVYPMNKETPECIRACAAKAIADMKRIASDVREAEDVRVHATWPIIQYFKGWGWEHFPTRAELHAMTFATICHGAKGMAWYAYCGIVDPAKKKFNYGVTSSPERWTNVCELATWLKELSPVLVERTSLQPAKPMVVSGPAKDDVGNDSISYLLKNHGDDVYLFAVNSAAEKVRATFRLNASGKAEVLRENRTVGISGGALADDFEPLAVHIYRFRDE